MPALDFPSSPTNGQVFGAYVYDSSITAWRSKGGATAATYVADTAPSGAVKGDMWYRSSDGTTYVYYVDADTSQWVEIRSEVSASKVGLVPIIPTSVSVASGSASVATDGSITFSGASSISVNGCFNASFRDYRISVVQSAASQLSDIWFRLRSGSTDDTTGYYGGAVLVESGSVTGWNSTADNKWLFGASHPGSTNTHASTIADITNPFVATAKTIQTNAFAWTGTSNKLFRIGSFNNNGVSRDGMTVYMGAGTLSGIIRIMGYN